MDQRKNGTLMSHEERRIRLPQRLVRIAVGSALLGMLSLSCSLVDNLLDSSSEQPSDSIPVQPSTSQPTAIAMDSPMPATALPASPTLEPHRIPGYLWLAPGLVAYRARPGRLLLWRLAVSRAGISSPCTCFLHALSVRSAAVMSKARLRASSFYCMKGADAGCAIR